MTDGPADRDVIDLAAAGSDDRDRVVVGVMARCPELSQDAIAEAFAADLPVESIWIQIGEQVLDAIDALDERLAALEQTRSMENRTMTTTSEFEAKRAAEIEDVVAKTMRAMVDLEIEDQARE